MKAKHVPLLILAGCLWPLALAPCAAPAQDFTRSVTGPVAQSLEIRKQSQQEADDWREEREKLTARYEELSAKSQALDAQKQEMEKRLALLTAAVEEQERELAGAAAMASGLEPLLRETVQGLRQEVEEGLPFQMEDRMARVQALERVLDDPDAGMGEKCRQVFQRLLAEVQCGNTTEAATRLIQVQGREIMAQVLRIGRLSLFFQTLDHKIAGFFDPVSRTWQPGPERFARDIALAVEIAAKRRPAELVTLPLGKVGAP